jgi:hypothetical protein
VTDINKINQFLQSSLRRKGERSVRAVEAAEWLDRAGLLADSKTRRGKPLRVLLRAKRIAGQRQETNRWWFIDRV